MNAPVKIDSDPARAENQPVPTDHVSSAAAASSAVVHHGFRLSAPLRHVAFYVLVVTAISGAAYVGWRYWTTWRFEVSTDDAYVQADVVGIAPQVSGDISQLFITDNQAVKAGQVMAIIDQRTYKAAVEQAKADVEQARAVVASTAAQIAQQKAVINEAEATINVDKAAETYAEQNNARYGTLANEGYGSVQNAQQAASAIASAKATIAKDQAALDAAQKQATTLAAQLEQAKASVVHNEAVLKQAEINLGYTTITAPVDGVIGARSIRLGEYVQPGTELLAIVPLAQAYVVANFKETQLADVRPGQPVRLSVDTFPGVTVRAFVNSLAPASGQEFALLPPDNATGNFTKIVQRIPVKITLDHTDPLAGLLRPGMSVVSTINTKGSRGDRAHAAAKP
ncbi:HlyD family secretion protein [Bradyrhizobium sp. BRP22]|uniref:HlyD family secretion protein n=1 Tax=Bradyrhizobium sp. BRP22 TaxID=2793821 RepID=UPI001CD719A5|nr:HlyD family secretion protein [Bradyrhizobium sp. BRP22]MCA1451769.1 HlyD family secretion protein [Bradyrhizobium sp. BRP22]